MALSSELCECSGCAELLERADPQLEHTPSSLLKLGNTTEYFKNSLHSSVKQTKTSWKFSTKTKKPKIKQLYFTYLCTVVWTSAVWAAHIFAAEHFLCLQGHWCKCATQWKEPVAIKQISLPSPSKVSLSCPWLRLIEHKFSFIWILNIHTKPFVSKLAAWLRHFQTIQLCVWSHVRK